MPFISFTWWPWLQRADETLFRFLNRDLANPLFDFLMPLLRKSEHWYPLYLFLLVFVLLNFKRHVFWWILFLMVTISIIDSTGTHLFKYTFERTRPCNEPALQDQLNLLVTCPSGFGFISNHAANHFGMATFIFLSFRPVFRKWTWLLFVWAGAISFAQVYVGVHYPTDILAGAAWGILAGNFTGRTFNHFFGLEHPGKAVIS